MKQILIAGIALVGLTASGSATYAAPIDFTYTGSLVDFTVPATGSYQITAFGAQGGNTNNGLGGRGAEIGGDFSLTAGEVIEIAVGGAGASTSFSNGGGGGGGGSFVVGPGNMPLVIAGGGGGAGTNIFNINHPGQGGLTGPDGGGNGGGIGGNGGGGGGINGGGGGGGFLSAGGSPPFGATGGGAFPGLAGGAPGGGFGGGGGTEAIGAGGSGGGGGGYSGGAGAGHAASGGGGGGGGGSFDAGIDQILMADYQTGNGEVVITEVAAPAPELSSIALLGVGLLTFTAALQRRTQKRKIRHHRSLR